MYFDSIEHLREHLTFHEIKGDEYWSCGGQIFDLFFTADKNGPTDRQILTYLDFQQESIMYVDKIRDKAIDKLEREHGSAPKRYHTGVPSVDVININEEGAATTMDIVLSFCTFRFLFYTRWKTWVVKFKGRDIVELEPAKRFPDSP